MRFPPTTLTPDELRLRSEVRAFLAEELTDAGTSDFGGGHDRVFSKRLAERGWVGMSIPTAYGGRGASAVQRFVVVAELLRAGAPVGAHWVADRQTAPSIVAFGTEEQKRRLLPAIAAAECTFSIGMSEPDSGSDLASIRTSARRDRFGWRVTGTKVWTSGAHHNDYVLTLCRTSPPNGDRHAGMSQLIVDLRGKGVSVNPILGLDGTHHFNEVVFDDAFVPDEDVLGTVGDGWRQVTSELAFERSGPDRWMSTYRVFRLFLAAEGLNGGEMAADAVGRIAARYRTLYQLSLSVARMIDGRDAPAAEAALVKDLGTTFEKQVVETVRSLAGGHAAHDPDSVFGRALSASVLVAPTFTIRGGTTEILRGIAAKELIR